MNNEDIMGKQIETFTEEENIMIKQIEILTGEKVTAKKYEKEKMVEVFCGKAVVPGADATEALTFMLKLAIEHVGANDKSQSENMIKETIREA